MYCRHILSGKTGRDKRGCAIHCLPLFCGQPDHSLGLGFSIALLVIGFFLFLIAPTSSDLHHQVRLSQTEICKQVHGKQKLYMETRQEIQLFSLFNILCSISGMKNN